MSLAPYRDGMKLGQGFNSYLQECLQGQVVHITPGSAGDDGYEPARAGKTEARRSCSGQCTPSGNSIDSGFERDSSWPVGSLCPELSEQSDVPKVEYYSSFVKGFKHFLDSRYLSLAAVINGSHSDSVNGAYLNMFTESDLNYEVLVRVSYEPNSVERFECPSGMGAVGFGDTFISGFIEGGEFHGLVSINARNKSKIDRIRSKVETALNLNTTSEAAKTEYDQVTKWLAENAEMRFSVQWKGGKNMMFPQGGRWDLGSLNRAAAAFPDEVSKGRPCRIFAILTKYSQLSQFHEQQQFRQIDYTPAQNHTLRIFEDYMKYKSIETILKQMRPRHKTFRGGLTAIGDLLRDCENTMVTLRKEIAGLSCDPCRIRMLYESPYLVEGRIPALHPSFIPAMVHVEEAWKPHRCMLSLDSPVQNYGWTPKFTFLAWKSSDIPDVVWISVRQISGPHRTTIDVGSRFDRDGWTERLGFYAYRTERPGTEMISVGEALNPHRMMLKKGSSLNEMGWTEKSCFWVPVI